MTQASLRAVGVGTPGIVVVDDETHVSLLAELWRGAARGVRNALYVQVGVGIRGAILIEGQIYRGWTGAAGDIGYLLGDDDPQPPQFRAGPFEWAAGGRAYVRLGARAAAGPNGALLRKLAGGDPARVTAETVYAAAAAGCVASREIVATLTARPGRGIALEPVERVLRERAPAPPRIVLSNLGDESVAVGAVRMAMDRANERIFAFAATDSQGDFSS